MNSCSKLIYLSLTNHIVKYFILCSTKRKLKGAAPLQEEKANF
jgi:hypothetical protein